jgi:hypothetical protein
MKRISFFSLLTILALLFSLSPVEPVHASAGQVSILAVPLDGNWSGIIDRGNPVSFTVTSSGTQWSNFQLSYSFTGSSCGNPSTSFTTGVNGPGSITNGSFSWSGSTDAFTGTFTSPNTATGTYAFTNKQFIVYPGGIPCFFYLTASGTWSASTYPAPGAFSKLSPADAANNQLPNLTLHWEASSAATSYEYCYGITNPCSNWTDNGTATSKALSGLIPNTTYYWQVRARNPAGTTDANGGTAWSFSVVQPSPLYLPLIIRADQPIGSFNKMLPANHTIDQSTSPSLSWTASSGATSYEYCLDTSNDSICNGTAVWTSTSASTSVDLSGLSPSTSYYWQVRANHGSGPVYADAGTWWSFTTAAPAKPAAGFWQSTTGEEFYVTPDQANVNHFALSIYLDQCGSSTKITRISPLVPIVNNQFSMTGSFYASGTFDSTTSAHGTVGLNSYYMGSCGYVTVGPFDWTAAWQNSSQPATNYTNEESSDSIIFLPYPPHDYRLIEKH